jgi:hypothetical protein
MAILSKSKLLAPRTTEVTIEDWGGEIVIRPLSGRERQDIHTFSQSEEGAKALIRMQAMAVAYACVEPDFASADEVLELSGAGISQAFDAVMKASGLGESADDTVGN